jgi:Protein of unknown function DUF262
MPFAPSETDMWERDLSPPPPETSNAKIDAKYEVQGRKLVLESNREKLQNFYEALRRPGYMDLQPFFQRRPRWTDEQKSRFIESFIINIPVPPLFLFEIKPNAYEVIDGQQRIRAIQDFFSGELELKGLAHWPELNGRKYSTLPTGVKAGIERRSISYSIVMRESAANEEEAAFIKRTVFERLNTGGAKMTAQEIRNSVFGGDFNKMIRELSEEAAFRAVWAPTFGTVKEKKHERNLVQGMIDVEQVLRFFAYRHAEHMNVASGRFLDAYMFRSKQFSKSTLKQLGKLFRDTFALSVELYGSMAFREYNSEKSKWGRVPRRAIADAELVALSDFIDCREQLLDKRDEVIAATVRLFKKHPLKLLRGHGTGDRVRWRIGLFRAILKKFSEGD